MALCFVAPADRERCAARRSRRVHAVAVPLTPFSGIPAPMAAPPFASHTLKNTGTVTLKMLFFEAKK